MKMVLRIKSTDFSEFAGMRFNNSQNKELDEYINIFISNSNLTAFQIEDDGQMNFDIVCYINNKLKNCRMFTKIDYDDGGNAVKYWLCFYKEGK